MAALRHRLCIVFIVTFSQLCVSEPLIKFSFQRPLPQSVTSGQTPQPQATPGQTPQPQATPGQAPQPQAQQYPFMTKLAQARAKLMTFVQNKLAELKILLAAIAPNAGSLTTTPQLAPGQQVPAPQIPGLSQLAGSLQNLLPALQSAAMNPPMLPPSQIAPGQQVPGSPTAPVQPSPVQPGASQPVATPGVQPPVPTPVQTPVQPPVQTPVQSPVQPPIQPPVQPPVQLPVQPPAQTPIAPQVQVQPQQAANPSG